MVDTYGTRVGQHLKVDMGTRCWELNGNGGYVGCSVCIQERYLGDGSTQEVGYTSDSYMIL